MNLWLPEFTQYPDTVAQAGVLFFALVIGHALADYPLQGDFLAVHKNRHHKPGAGLPPRGLWLHCLLAHCLIQAGMVWLITGRVIFALAELVLHFILDALKCEGRTNLHVDQLGHVACKALFVVALLYHWVP